MGGGGFRGTHFLIIFRTVGTVGNLQFVNFFSLFNTGNHFLGGRRGSNARQ